MATFAERLSAIRGGGSFEERLTALRTRHGSSGGWEEGPTDPRARLGDTAWRAIKGAASELNPAGIVDAIAHPVDTVRRLVDTRDRFGDAARSFAMATPGGEVEPSVMDPRSRLDYAAEGAAAALESIPVIGPIAQGVTERVVDSAASGDVAGAVGRVGGAALLARAPKMAPAVARAVQNRGAAGVAAAEGQYARNALGGGPLAESLAPEMMRRGIGAEALSDPAKLATNAERAATASATEAAALDAARTATRGKRGAADMRTRIDKQRAAALDDVDFQNNLRTISEQLPKSRGVGNILIDGAKRVAGSAGGGAVAHAFGLPGYAVGGAAAGASVVKTLNEIRKTPAFQASSALAKRQFSEALAKSDLTNAARFGTQILSGAMLADDFGHAGAVRALAEDLSQYQQPELRRIAASSFSAYYVPQKGEPMRVPQTVMIALTNGKNVSEVDSPLNQWLSAMARQNKIKKGGRLEFRDTSGRVVSGAGGTLTE